MGPFLVVGRRSAGVKALSVRVATHNHDPTSPDALPSLQRLRPAQCELLSSLTNIGLKPRQIAAQLQQSRSTSSPQPLLPRNFDNARHQLTHQMLEGRTPIQSLLTQFAAGDFVSE